MASVVIGDLGGRNPSRRGPIQIPMPKGNPPVCVSAPIVSGTVSVGQTLSTSFGTWTSPPGKTIYYDVVWQRDTVDIPGSHGFYSYVVQNADLGRNITSVIRAANTDGTIYQSSLPVGSHILNVLSLSNNAFTLGAPASGSILGLTLGSTLTDSGLPSCITVDTTHGTFAYDGTGSISSGSFNLTETLSGYSNSPNTTIVSYSITNASSPPVLSSPTATATGSQTATLGVSTNEGNGTLYYVVSTSATPPSAAQILAGEDSTGGAAATNGNQAVTATGAQTMSATGLAPSTVYYSYFLQINTSAQQSNIASAASITTLALSTPTVTNVSALGAAPLVLALSDADYVAGKYLQWEFAASLTPPKNGDGSYTTATQKGVTFIDGNSWARLDLALGYATPSGAFAFHCRVLVDDSTSALSVTDQLGNTFKADASNWSTDYTDTISVSVATLTSGTSNAISPYLNINNSNYSFIHTSNIGIACLSLATIAAVNSQWHTEISIDGWNSGGHWCVAISDGTLNFHSPGYQTTNTSACPGYTAAGLLMTLAPSGTALAPYYNGNSQTAISLPQAAAVGDSLILEVNESAKTIKVYWYTAATTSVSGLLGTITLTTAPSSWYFCAGGMKGTGTQATSDSGTWNPGNNPFHMTPTSGYLIYG